VRLSSRQPAGERLGESSQGGGADRLAVESSDARTEHRRSEQPVPMSFGPQKLRRGSPARLGAAGMLEDYNNFPMGSDWRGCDVAFALGNAGGTTLYRGSGRLLKPRA
jgi:hypothetical protein